MNRQHSFSLASAIAITVAVYCIIALGRGTAQVDRLQRDANQFYRACQHLKVAMTVRAEQFRRVPPKDLVDSIMFEPFGRDADLVNACVTLPIAADVLDVCRWSGDFHCVADIMELAAASIPDYWDRAAGEYELHDMFVRMESP